MGSHPVGTAGNDAGQGTPLTGNANALGIFDMGGNVYELCFSEHLTDTQMRVRRGGSWSSTNSFLRVGDVSGNSGNSPSSASMSVGFRLSRTP